MLDEISRYENDNGRPLLSAVVVHAADKRPGKEFFELVRELRPDASDDPEVVFADVLRDVYEYWSRW